VQGTTAIGWQTQDLNEAGACGDATRADASLGKELAALVRCGVARPMREFGATPPSHDMVVFEATPRESGESFLKKLAMLRNRRALDTPRVPDSIETRCND